MDDPPKAGNPSCMWSNIIVSPASKNVNRAVINKHFQLGNQKLLEVIMSKIIVAIKKTVFKPSPHFN
jgi:hypothetical protein